MRYFVIGEDGQKYGPADVATLQGWIGENRLLPTQQVEEEGSGIRMAAAAIPDIKFPPAAPQQPAPGGAPGSTAGSAPGGQQGSPYGGYQGVGVQPNQYQASGTGGQTEIIFSYILAPVSLVLCCFAGIGVPVILSGVAVFLAHRAEGQGHPNPAPAKIIAWVCLILNILLFIALLVFRSALTDWVQQYQQQHPVQPR